MAGRRGGVVKGWGVRVGMVGEDGSNRCGKKNK